jgi:hypothetical protein
MIKRSYRLGLKFETAAFGSVYESTSKPAFSRETLNEDTTSGSSSTTKILLLTVAISDYLPIRKCSFLSNVAIECIQ